MDIRKKSERAKKPFYKRWWFIGLVIIIIIGVIGSGGDDTKKEDPQESNSSAVSENSNATEFKREDMSLDQYLEHMIKEVMGEETNTDKPVFVSITDEVDGIKEITLNANDNLTKNMITTGMLYDSKEFFKAICDDEEVQSLNGISLIYQMVLVDKYGNESDSPVLLLTLTLETMNKTNWDRFLYNDFPEVADIYYISPILQD